RNWASASLSNCWRVPPLLTARMPNRSKSCADMRTEQERSLLGGGGGGAARAARASLPQDGDTLTDGSCAQGRASPLRARRLEVMDANLALLIYSPNVTPQAAGWLHGARRRDVHAGAAPGSGGARPPIAAPVRHRP